MKYITFLLLFFTLTMNAQTDLGLVASFSFDGIDCPVIDDGMDPGIISQPAGNLDCGCGVSGNGLLFDGVDAHVVLSSSKIKMALGTVDFTLSFYFKPQGGNSAESQVLFSKRKDCNADTSFIVKYVPSIKSLSVELVEDAIISASVATTLTNSSCWYHVAIVRKDGSTILYINGEEKERVTAIDNQRVNMLNDEFLYVGRSECSTDAFYHGFIDEIRLYTRALSRDEIEDLYFAPDQINVKLNVSGMKELTVLLDSSIQIDLNSTCAVNFQWTPTDGVSNDTIAEPIITPSETTTYVLEMDDGLQCVVYDSVRIVVVDPKTIDCTDILLPSAFTPNDDGLNDEFGISNPFSTGELLAFDIYDRWGNIVYSSKNVLGRWNGTYKGTLVNPGVFLYKIHFRCEGKEAVKSGSVTVLR